MRILLMSTLMAAALAVAVPAQAHGGPGRHGHQYAPGHYKHQRHVHRNHHRRQPPHRVVRSEVNNYYYGYDAPIASVPPGVHVVFPSIFLPWP